MLSVCLRLAAATQEEKSALRRIRAKRTEHVNLLAKQLQEEEANNEDADDHAAGNASSLKDAKQLLLQEDADVQGGSDDGDSDASLNNGGAGDGEGGGFSKSFGSGGLSTRVSAIDHPET